MGDCVHHIMDNIAFSHTKVAKIFARDPVVACIKGFKILASAGWEGLGELEF